MRVRSLLLLAGACLLAGCTSVQTIYMDEATDETFTVLNAHGEHQMARLTLFGQPSMTANGLHVRPDSTAWLSTRTGRRFAVPTSAVEEVRFAKKRIVKGAVIGAGFGMAVGLALGEDCQPQDLECISRWDLAPMGGLVSGAFGGVIGSRGQLRFRFVAATQRPAQARRE